VNLQTSKKISLKQWMHYSWGFYSIKVDILKVTTVGNQLLERTG